ncbi:unnamed protein product [Rotaria sordida]|uniref:Pyrroloquinoline quinone-dependent pyranose dehydrogenase beta-propeller domain-containing protein n=1 Tax=Rotaria sordida TaxID=392033 RepID=A0A814FMK0_9BILA|nr:unnamed protein product [Rotaria sordida]
MFSSFVKSVFLSLILPVLHQTNGTNITFVPQSIHITVADLPEPYATPHVVKEARVYPVPENPLLYVPDGFTVKLYMSGLSSPRYLIYTPSGDILVSETIANRISCLIDNNNYGYPDQRLTFADTSNGLNFPFGMAFVNGYFYVGNQDITRRYLWTFGSRNITGTEPLPQASVQQANLDGSNQTTFVYGIRNPVGLTFHPITNNLYATCNERDGVGDDLVPDYFTHIQQNDFYGWPYAYMSSNLTDPRRCFSNGTSERPDLVSITKTPDVLFQAHSTPLDTRFYTDNQFPSRYRNGAFVTFHGSLSRSSGVGFDIVFIPFDNITNRPLGYYEKFVYGFLTNPEGPDTFGRPVGLLVLNDATMNAYAAERHIPIDTWKISFWARNEQSEWRVLELWRQNDSGSPLPL